jgi:hypothetical protein
MGPDRKPGGVRLADLEVPVRRLDRPSASRVDSSHPVTAAYSSISLPTVASVSGLRPSDASFRSLPSSICASRSSLTVDLRRICCRVSESAPAYTDTRNDPFRQSLYVPSDGPQDGSRTDRMDDNRSTNRSTPIRWTECFRWWGARGSNPEPTG